MVRSRWELDPASGSVMANAITREPSAIPGSHRSFCAPVPKRAAYMKFRQPASRFALVGVFVAQTAGGVRVAVTGAAPSVFRSKPLEEALGKSFTADAAKGAKIDAKGLNADLHGSAEYRAHLIPVMAARAVATAG